MRLAVFCGSKPGSRPDYAAAAQAVARHAAQKGIGLVFGGGRVGLMGVLADAGLAAGAEVIGVIPRGLVEEELAHTGLTLLEVVETMHQRKYRMSDLADAFLALPGGYGTMDELFEIITWAQLRLHDKPIGLLNVAGYFDPVLAWIDRAGTEAFIHKKHLSLVCAGDRADALIDELVAAASARPGRSGI
jgi:uncharacterized protein (TIGR00730 family)